MIRRFLPPDRDHRAGTSPMAADPNARPAAAGAVELGSRSIRIGAGAKDGCGNDAPMEITERFPQPLGRVGGRRSARGEPVSSPRRIKLLVRISRKQLSCAVRPKGYEAYRTGTAAGA